MTQRIFSGSHGSATYIRWRSRILTACIVLAAVFSISLAPASAQQSCVKQPHVIGAVEFMASHSDMTSEWPYGIAVSGEITSVHFWGIRADLSGEHWNSPSTRYFGGIGPEASFRRGRFRVHAAALAGMSRTRVWIPTSTPSILAAATSGNESRHLSDPEYSFAIRTGGGLDMRLSHRWMLRLAEVTYTDSFSAASPGTVDFSGGVAYIF